MCFLQFFWHYWPKTTQIHQKLAKKFILGDLNSSILAPKMGRLGCLVQSEAKFLASWGLLIWPHHPRAENLKFVIFYPRGGNFLVARCVKTYMHASLVIPIVRSPKNITIHLSSYSPIGKNDTLSLGGKN